MPAILSAKPKRIRQFILNGKIYDGGMEEAYAQQQGIGNNLGGAGSPNGVSTPPSPYKET